MNIFIIGLVWGIITFFLFGEIVGIKITYLNKFNFSFLGNIWFYLFMGICYIYLGIIYGVILGLLGLGLDTLMNFSLSNILLVNAGFSVAMLGYFLTKWQFSQKEWVQILSGVIIALCSVTVLNKIIYKIIDEVNIFWLPILFFPSLIAALIRSFTQKKGVDKKEKVVKNNIFKVNAYNLDKKLIFIGLDGCDWKLLNKFLKNGRLPNLKRIIDKGVYTKLKTVSPTDSPLIWNSIFTGKEPEKHGILNWHKTKFPGLPPVKVSKHILYPEDSRAGKIIRWLRKRNVVKRIPVTTKDRKSKAIWNILSDYNKISINVGWLCTWPAEEIKGIQVSWYMYPFREVIRHPGKFGLINISRRTYPEKLASELEKFIVKANDLKENELKKVNFTTGDIDYNKKAADKLNPWEYAKDKTFIGISHYLLDKYKNFNLFSLYLYGIDGTCHAYWPFFEGATNNEKYKNEILSISNTEKFRKEAKDFNKCILKYYEYMDEEIGKLLKSVGDDCNLVIISDHGFDFDGTVHAESPDGVFIASGPYIKKNEKVKDITIYDILPTLLALSGVPIEKNMKGKVKREILTAEFLEQYPPKYVESYGRFKGKGEDIGDTLDKQTCEGMEKRLRALGYID